MKLCSLCKFPLALTEFYRHPDNKDGYQSRCKDCTKRQAAISIAQRAVEIEEHVRNYKESNPCADCQRFYPFYVMDFDHLRDKKFMLSDRRSYTLKRVILEMDKCELVCANCHRERTYKRLLDDIVPADPGLGAL